MSGETRPWGFFTVLGRGEGWWVKMISVRPGHRLSLQSHEKRWETWTVVEGEGEAQIEGNTLRLRHGQVLRVDPRERHRLSNPFARRLVVMEVATGICEEGDVTRYEDDYGREVKR